VGSFCSVRRVHHSFSQNAGRPPTIADHYFSARLRCLGHCLVRTFLDLGGWNAFYGTIALGVMTLFVLIYQAKPLPANVLAETVRGN